MGPAVRSASPLSPAAARQGSASDGGSSMWAAVLLGVLTAFFAWLWFSRSGDDEDRTDSPKSPLQPVREEEEEEEENEKLGSAEPEPITPDTPGHGEKDPRTPPAAQPVHRREEPSDPLKDPRTPPEGEHSTPLQAPGTPPEGEHSTHPEREHSTPLQAPGTPPEGEHSTPLQAPGTPPEGEHSTHPEREHRTPLQASGTRPEVNPSIPQKTPGTPPEVELSTPPQAPATPPEVEPSTPPQTPGIHPEVESSTPPLVLRTPPEGEHSTPAKAPGIPPKVEPSTPPQVLRTHPVEEHSRPQHPDTPRFPQGDPAREHGAPLARHTEQGDGEGEAQEPGTSLTPNLGGDGRNLQEDPARPTLQSRQERDPDHLLHIAPSSLDSLRDNEMVNLQEPVATSTLEDPQISDEGRVQEPTTPLNLVPQQVHESTERTQAPLTLVGEEHILQVPEALSTSKSEVIKLPETSVSLTSQSHQDSESKSLEHRASPTLACKQAGEAGIPGVDIAPQTLEPKPSQEVKSLKTQILPVRESHQDSEERKAQESTTPLNFVFKQEHELKLQEPQFPQTLEPQFEVNAKLQDLSALLPSQSTSQQASEACALQESRVPQLVEVNDVSPDGILKEAKVLLTQASNNGSQNGILQEPKTCDTLDFNEESQACMIEKSEVPLTPQSSEDWQDGILQKPEEPLTLQSYESRDSILQNSHGSQDRIQQAFQPPYTLESNEESQHDLTPIVPITRVYNKSQEDLVQEPEAPLTPQSNAASQHDMLQESEALLPSQSNEDSQHDILWEPESPLPSQSNEDSQRDILWEPEAPLPSQSNEDSQRDILWEPESPLPSQSNEDSQRDILWEPESPLPSQSNEDSQRDILWEPESPLPSQSNEDSQRDILWEPEAPLPSQSNEDSQRDILWEPQSPVPSQSSEDCQRDILWEPEAPLPSQSSEESQHDLLLEHEAPLTSRSNESQCGLLQEHEAPLTSWSNEDSQLDILREPAMPPTQFIEKSQDGILQELKHLESQQENQENMLQDVNFPVSLESKQESQEKTILEAKASEIVASQSDKETQEYVTTIIVSKQKNEALQQDPRSPTGLESQQNGLDCKLQESRVSLPSSLVSKQESKEPTLQEPRCLLTIEINKTSEDCKPQELIDPLTLESKQENQENTLPEVITAQYPESKQENEDRSLQEHKTQIALVFQQEDVGINLQESKAFLTLESQQNYEESKAQEPTAPLTLSMKEKEIKSQEPRSPPTLGFQHDGGMSELKDAPFSSSLISNLENEECILQVPKPPLAFEPNEEVQHHKLQELSTCSCLESSQVNKENGHPEDRAPQTIAKEDSYIALHLLKKEQYNEWEMHPREVPAECGVTEGDLLHQVKEEHKPDSVKNESPNQKQGCEMDTQFQNEHPESKKELRLSSAHEKLGLNLNEFGEEAKGDAMDDVCLNGHEQVMDQCVALVDADNGGQIHGQEERPSETSGELTNVQVLEIDVNESKDIKDMDPKTSPMLSQSNEEISDIRSPNLNYKSSGADLENLSDADLKPSDGDHEQIKKVAAVQPMQQFVKVGFKVHYVTNMDSQQIAVIGDHEKLGGWEDYILLTCNKDGFWTHSVSLPADSTMEWKFVMVENGKIKRWEECANRFLKTNHDDIYAHQWWGYL